MYACFSPIAMPRRSISLWCLLLPAPATCQGPQRMKWKVPNHTFLLSNSPLRCRLSKLQSVYSFLYSHKQTIREKQVMHDYSQTWLWQHGSELSLIWKVGHSFCIHFFSLKAAVIIAWWRRKKGRKKKKKQIHKSKKPGTQDIFAGAGPLESEPWHCSAIASVDSYHLFMEKKC